MANAWPQIKTYPITFENTMKMKKWIYFTIIFFLTSVPFTKAQMQAQIGNGSTAASTAGPIYQNSSDSMKSRVVILYTEEELAEANIFPGDTIKELAWFKNNDAVLQNNATCKVEFFQRSGLAFTEYITGPIIQDYTDTSLASGNGWAYIGTNEFSPGTNNWPSATGWMPFTIDPFVYNGGSLEIFIYTLIMPDYGNISNKNIVFRYLRSADTRRVLYSGRELTPVLAFTTNEYRANILITYARQATRVRVNRITEPEYICPGTYPLKAEIQNTGSTPVNSMEVQWTLNGILQTPVQWNNTLDTIGGAGSDKAIITLHNNVSVTANSPVSIKAWGALPNGISVRVMPGDTLGDIIRSGLSGAYTVGGANPDFGSFSDAVNALNKHGVCGPVVMNIRPGDYDGQNVLNNIRGSDMHSITFRSTTGNRNDVRITNVQTSTGDNYVLRIQNVSNLTFKNITLEATGTTALYTTVLELWDTTSNLTIDSCGIKARQATSNSNSTALVYARSRGSSTLGYTDYRGENLVITNSRFEGGGSALYLYGTTMFNANFYPDIVFENNVIDTPGAQGLYLYYVKGVKINHNRITLPGSNSSPSTQYGVFIQNGIDGGEINNNRMYIPGTTSTSATSNGIYLNTVTGNSLQPFVIANNEIAAAGNGGSSASAGLYGTNGSHLRIYNNSINIIRGSLTNMYAAYFSYATTSYTNNQIYNNVFVHNAGGRALFAQVIGNTHLLDYNLIYTSNPGGTLVQRTTTPVSFTSLSAWRAASGWGLNSISYRAPFRDSVDLRPDPADSASWALNGRGMHMPGNNRDINGNARSETLLQGVPDLGAHEFVPLSLPPIAIPAPGVVIPGDTQVFTFGEDTVASIVWNGTAVPASVQVRQYTGTVAPGFTGADSMYFYTDIQAAGAPYDYDAAIYYKNPWTGSVKSEAGIRLAEKPATDPWVFYSGSASVTDTVRNIISSAGLTTLGLYTGFGEGCSGQPAAPVIVTPPLTTTQCPGSVFRIEANDPDITSGIVYQWQQAPSSAGPWANVPGGTQGAGLTYETPPLPQATYYRLKSTCAASSDSIFSSAYEIPIVPAAQVLSWQDASRCGPGMLTLEAEGSAGATMHWYESAAGGVLLDTGNTYTTSVLTATDTFYVSASANTKMERVPSPEPDNVFNNHSSHNGLIFRANNHITIHTVDAYIVNSSTSGTLNGTIKIYIRDMSNNVLDSAALYSFTATTNPTLHVIPVEISLPPGQYKMVSTITGGYNVGLMTKFSNTPFPYNSPSGAVSILISATGATGSSNDYKFFFNWSVSVPCESPRQPVIATLGAAPDFQVSATPVVCNDGISTLTVMSVPANFDSVTWAPVAGLYANAAGTIPYTGGNAATVYARTGVAGRHTFVAAAYNTNTSCGNIDTVRHFVQPAQATATANPADICVNGATTLRLDHAPDYATGTLQWQSAPDGISYTDISGALSPTHLTGFLNTTTYYRAVLKNSDGVACINVPLTVRVNQAEVLSANSVIRCGADSVTLTANGSPGSVLKWYNTISGGSLLDTGVSFTTPFLGSTTTFYVSAEAGKRSNYIGRQYRTTAGTVSNSNDSGGLFFDAYVPFVLDSVAVYPVGTGTGTVTIFLNTANGARLDSTTVTVTGTPAPGIKTFVPVHFNVPAGSLLLIVKRTGGGVTGLMRESVAPASNEIIFPYTIAGLTSVIRGTGSSVITKTYPFLYDWKVSQPCESSRTPVTATITQPPPFTAEALPANICVGDTTTLTATSANTEYVYEWTPGAYTGSNIPVAPANNTVYYVKASDNSGGPNDGCVNYDSVIVSVNTLPPATITSAGNTAFCEGDSVFLFANSGPGYSFQWQLNNTDITGAITSFIYAKEDGAYTVKVTDRNTCMTISDPEDITVHPTPVPVISPAGSVITTGSYSSYQWYRNGTLIPGATNQRHTPEGDGNYTVLVRDNNGCSGISDPYSFSVSVRNINAHPDVRIYPNPASSTVYIESPVPVQVTLSSVDGKVVFHQKGVQQIDISSLSDAVYMIRVADLDGQVLNLSRLVKAAK